MSQVYVVGDDGRTVAMERIQCKNEDAELQQLLENNHDLLPGDQINPEDPRRWLLVRREMPVEDPSSGDSRWSIDFLFADQSGTPTFVECKRFLDTRSRREVVAQMLEYAANGHYYWTTDLLRRYASESAEKRGMDLEEAVRSVTADETGSVDDFLESMVNNLREGQVRLVFFLEEAPHELRSIVDFLNKQMERSEVLIVEAKQYRIDGVRVVAPSLFGYTEEARRVKRTVTLTQGNRKTWTERAFFDDARSRLDDKEFNALETLTRFLKSHSSELKLGKGRKAGSMSFSLPGFESKSTLSVYSDGSLTLPFGGLNGGPAIEGFRDELAEVASTHLQLTVPEDYRNRYPSVKVSEWGQKVDSLIHVLSGLFTPYLSVDSVGERREAS